MIMTLQLRFTWKVDENLHHQHHLIKKSFPRPQSLLMKHDKSPSSKLGDKSYLQLVKSKNYERILSRNKSMAQNESTHLNSWHLPPLDEVLEAIKKGNLTAGQVALDFAIIGHAKCGTSAMSKPTCTENWQSSQFYPHDSAYSTVFWLGEHPEVASLSHEFMGLQKGDPTLIIKRIYKRLPDGPYKRGYKSPSDVEDQRAIRLLRELFPKTKLFIGVRHPVRWFESLYNYRVQNGFAMPPVEELPAKCMANQFGVCMNRAFFHLNLARLAKTPLDERELVHFHFRIRKKLEDKGHFIYSPNPVFLYDLAQLGDKNHSRTAQFRHDVKRYLGLTQEFPPVIHFSPGHGLNETEQARRDLLKIDICQSRYDGVRQAIIREANGTQYWIRNYFLKSPDVYVSNPDNFHEILDSYTRDPCRIS